LICLFSLDQFSYRSPWDQVPRSLVKIVNDYFCNDLNASNCESHGWLACNYIGYCESCACCDNAPCACFQNASQMRLSRNSFLIHYYFILWHNIWHEQPCGFLRRLERRVSSMGYNPVSFMTFSSIALALKVFSSESPTWPFTRITQSYP